MAPVEPVSDSTDWLPTPLAALASFESSLRCQVCKDFFNTPMITSCSHTFCSLCIRRYLSQEGKCPACRQNDQESKLRRNWVVEELVANFTDSRKGLLEFANTVSVDVAVDDEDIVPQRPKKRRKLEDAQVSGGAQRSTRSQSKRSALQASQESVETNDEEVIPDSDAESEYEDDPERSVHFPSSGPEPHDGLVACPICSRRMKEEAVYSHLNTCPGPGSGGTELPLSQANGTAKSLPTAIAYTTPSATMPEKRLPTLNYSMLNDNALRKKLKELGISNSGSKLLMQKRHTEWINLFNANSDSRRPRSKRELLYDLDTWERTQGKQIAHNIGPSGVMSKEFDGESWVKSNKDGFADLIRKAREKRANATTATGNTTESASVPQEEEQTPIPGNTILPGIHEQTHSITNAMNQEPLEQRQSSVVDLTTPTKVATQELEPRSSQQQDIAT